MKKKRKLMLALIVAVAAIAAMMVLKRSSGADEAQPVFAVAEGPLTIGISTTGSIHSRDKLIMRSELEGKNTILWVVDDGVNVKTGDLLVEFLL